MQCRTQIARRCASVACIGLLALGCGAETVDDVATPSTGTDLSTPPATEAVAIAAAAPTSTTSTTVEPEPVEIDSSTTSSTTVVSRDVCRRLTDFDDDNSGWIIVNDGVMGGRSNGAVAFVDSTMQFTGSVVTRGGGFTSVRLQLDGDELDDTNRIEIRLRADERTYGLTFEDNSLAGRRAISHNADLDAVPPPGADGWSTISLGYDQLRPSVFGQPIDAEPFDSDEAREIGIIIGDGIDGEFALVVDWIDACTD